MKNVNNSQIAKVKPEGVAQHLLDFLPILADVPYKSVAYKKACIRFVFIEIIWNFDLQF